MIYVLPTRQPPRLASSRNRSTSSLLNKDATEMEPCKIRGTTQPLVSRTGAGRQGNIFSFRSREKNVLDFSSYRSGFCTNNSAKQERHAPLNVLISVYAYRAGHCVGPSAEAFDSLCT